ncbi:MAG: hypothetical protein HYV27_14620 [Candidatus Hydrogenedentes bacterium]|nr:hypothetical protein [Candidatus Hydrogenedentota bacterium]
MVRSHGIRDLFLFCAKFLVLVAPLTALWWWLLPHYGWLLIQAGGGILRFVLGVPILAGRIDPAGILNTASVMIFDVAGEEVKAKITVVITNVPVYWALIFATPQILPRRRALILLGGSALLVAGHIAFIVYAIRFGSAVGAASQIPTAVVQVFITLPFLLWIILAYWDKLVGAFNEDPKE